MRSGGEHESLAPVIPLFGGAVPEHPEGVSDHVVPDGGSGVEESASSDPSSGEGSWHPTWAADRPGAAEDAVDSPGVELAEKALLKKLRTRSLSLSEARGVLREHDLDEVAVESVLASLEEYGYLDDAALAEQLIHAGVDRKGQGRQAIAQTLAKRGIPRDVADAALAALPDDDLERALEFARGKVRSLTSVDRDTALRRLSGQLARRGYGGSLAMTAARIALDERSAPSSGVRFR
ncbi:regulatory protein RecX [Microbacterium sp. AZCO]|uniref:regulatory protein RecX n=1 Tax=Microbacterium sp. AZCO TaxID=3142976 RepID=UPI0031F3606E